MIGLSGGFWLDEPVASDRDSYIEWLNDPWFSRVIPIMPYPYTEDAADFWVGHCAERKARCGLDPTLAIREPGGRLIGCIGIDQLEVGKDFRAEFGYWLAKPYWGRGLMSEAVRQYVGFAFGPLRLERLFAHVLTFNVASARVLEKAGFRREGTLRSHMRTREGLFDAHLYGLLKVEVGEDREMIRDRRAVVGGSDDLG